MAVAWPRIVFLMQQKAAQQFTYKNHVTVGLIPENNIILNWNLGHICIEKSSLLPSYPTSYPRLHSKKGSSPMDK